MMSIDIKDTITLDDDNKYLVISKVTYRNDIFYYLIDEKDKQVKFCIENSKNNSLTEIKDEEMIRTLLPMFVNVTKGLMSEME